MRNRKTYPKQFFNDLLGRFIFSHLYIKLILHIKKLPQGVLGGECVYGLRREVLSGKLRTQRMLHQLLVRQRWLTDYRF